MQLPSRLRFEIFRRDEHRCRYCGRTSEETALRVDHVIPQVLGGSNDPENLVTACQDCNAGKSSTLLEELALKNVRQLDFDWAKTTRQVYDEMIDLADYWNECVPYVSAPRFGALMILDRLRAGLSHYQLSGLMWDIASEIADEYQPLHPLSAWNEFLDRCDRLFAEKQERMYERNEWEASA